MPAARLLSSGHATLSMLMDDRPNRDRASGLTREMVALDGTAFRLPRESTRRVLARFQADIEWINGVLGLDVRDYDVGYGSGAGIGMDDGDADLEERARQINTDLLGKRS